MKIWKQAGAELCQAQGKLELVWLWLDPCLYWLTNMPILVMNLILELWLCCFGLVHLVLLVRLCLVSLVCRSGYIGLVDLICYFWFRRFSLIWSIWVILHIWPFFIFNVVFIFEVVLIFKVVTVFKVVFIFEVIFPLWYS